MSGCSQKALVLMIMPIYFFYTKNQIKSLFSVELKLQVWFLFAQQSIWSFLSWYLIGARKVWRYQSYYLMRRWWWLCLLCAYIDRGFFSSFYRLGWDVMYIYMDWLVYDAIFSHISALLCVLMGNMCLKPLLTPFLTIYMYTLIFRR